MKVKIKGLVFVGFAAAILSANAMAAQRTRPAGSSNTVTSQAFTESKYEWLSDKVGTTPAANSELWESEDAYPSMVVLKDVADAVTATNNATQAKSTANYQLGGTGGTWKQVEAGTYVAAPVQGTTANDAKIDIKTDQIADTVAKIDAGGSPLTTAGAVEDYVNVRGVKVNGSALTPDASKDVDVTVTEGATDGTVAVNGQDVAVHNAEVTTHKLVQGENQGSVITSSATDTQYPSAKAVYNALTDTSNVGNGTVTATQNGVTVGTFDLNQAGNGSITILKPDWDQATTTAADYIANKPTISNDSADITGAVVGDSKELPTTYAVQQYVQNITNGNVIPEQDPTVCTVAHPCALVNEAGTLHWYTMAQSNYAGGELGDAQ